MEQPPPVGDPAYLVAPGSANPDLAACVAAWDQLRHFHGTVIWQAVMDMTDMIQGPGA